MLTSLRARGALLSIAIFVVFIGIWHIAVTTGGGPAGPAVDPEYAKLVGAAAAVGQWMPARGWRRISTRCSNDYSRCRCR